MEIFGRLVVHKHDKNWRIRDLKHHPIDPNWETGTYCKCHEDMRHRLEMGMWIFDVIWLKKGTFPYLRSAFKIKSKKNEILNFDSYWFNDGDLLEITPDVLPKIKRGPYSTKDGIRVSNKDGKAILSYMQKNSCNKYERGQRPSSISINEWKTMVKTASVRMFKRHVCSFDK